MTSRVVEIHPQLLIFNNDLGWLYLLQQPNLNNLINGQLRRALTAVDLGAFCSVIYNLVISDLRLHYSTLLEPGHHTTCSTLKTVGRFVNNHSTVS
jgi:hypothetical protein